MRSFLPAYERSHSVGAAVPAAAQQHIETPRSRCAPPTCRATTAARGLVLPHPVGISAHRWGDARARARLLGGDLRAQNAERRDSLEDG